MLRKLWTRASMLIGAAAIFGVASAASPASAKAQPVVVVRPYYWYPTPPAYVYGRPYWRDRDWRYREWREHERREHEWREHEWREHHDWR